MIAYLAFQASRWLVISSMFEAAIANKGRLVVQAGGHCTMKEPVFLKSLVILTLCGTAMFGRLPQLCAKYSHSWLTMEGCSKLGLLGDCNHHPNL